ncbi:MULTISPECIES: hypothetical protein [unclassified Nocardioides]|uniref:hypothetical protein n=1 Tax=unclassified Nocardioides TaxID=2615069 RepID=UPI00301503A8
MAFALTRNSCEHEPAPTAPLNAQTGEPWPLAMRFGGGWKWCWADDVEELVAVLTGNPDAYLEAVSEQERLVQRIRTAISISVKVQTEVIHAAQQTGDWDRLRDSEKEMLLSPRHEQPAGLDEDLFGEPWWTAAVPLLIVSTGYLDRPMPRGKHVWVIDPGLGGEEDLLDSLCDLGVIEVFHRDIDD